MKKIRFLSALLAVSLMSAGMISCGNSKDEGNKLRKAYDTVKDRYAEHYSEDGYSEQRAETFEKKYTFLEGSDDKTLMVYAVYDSSSISASMNDTLFLDNCMQSQYVIRELNKELDIPDSITERMTSIDSKTSGVETVGDISVDWHYDPNNYYRVNYILSD